MARIVDYTEEHGLERLPKLAKRKDPTHCRCHHQGGVDVAKNREGRSG